ncbi:hypothetical protein CERZMDRAFT_81227 [Cercospora zeae-maydis SCOH1-5]|uniref:Uncharacterized protein n=1 Tax=Cercospora zeae-maydis SCOH1-5 TaxID=717836 RepID=A0A6A6FUZ3_9PEZI|nr:hypothetical protein CERZMDRAFT_81227 [Cercospora zeae-maydis SCOH1-5]
MAETTYRDQIQRSKGYTTMIDNGGKGLSISLSPLLILSTGKFDWCPRETAQASSAAATEGSNSRHSQYEDARNGAKYDASTSLYGIGAQFETSPGRNHAYPG